MKRWKTFLIGCIVLFCIGAHEWWKYSYEERTVAQMNKDYFLVYRSSAHGSSIWTPWTFFKAPYVELKFSSKKLIPINDTIVAVEIMTTEFDEEDEDMLVVFNLPQQKCTTVNGREEMHKFLKNPEWDNLKWLSFGECEDWVGELYLRIDLILNGPEG